MASDDSGPATGTTADNYDRETDPRESITQNNCLCLECRDFRASLDEVRDHVGDEHNTWWGSYLSNHGLRSCRVCGESLEEAGYYCGDGCRKADESPPNPCPECGIGLWMGVSAASEHHQCEQRTPADAEPDTTTETSSQNLELSEDEDPFGGGLDVAEIEDAEPPPDDDTPEYPLLEDDDHEDINVSLQTPYDIDPNFVCVSCHQYSVDDISYLIEHVVAEHDTSWEQYLTKNPLHRCAGCETRLESVERVFCQDCADDPDITPRDVKVPCQYCGTTYVHANDPFCSAECAANGIAYGAPLDPPGDPDADYLQGDFRTEDGIPYAAPLASTYQFVCLECYNYGSDELHGLATHVGKGHSIEWGTYIEKHCLRLCRTCGSPLDTLTSRYCDLECQLSDPDPVDTCYGCGRPVDMNRVFCTQSCYFDNMEITE